MLTSQGPRRPPTPRHSRYRRLFTRPGVAAVVVYGLVARVPSGMNVLAVMLAVTAAGHSYALAGAAAGSYAVGAGVSGPLRGRLVDRRGAARVLLTTGLAQLVAMAVLFGVTASDLPGAFLLPATFAVGALLPPVAPVMRTLWDRVLEDDEELKAAAFAWETVVMDLVFIIGPGLLAALVGLVPPEACLGLSAVCTLIGCAGLATRPEVRALGPAPAGPRHWTGALRVPAVRARLPVAFLATGSLAAVEVAALGFAGELGTPAHSGWLLAALSVGSAAGGLLYGAVRLPGGVSVQLVAALALLTAAWALASHTAHPLALAALFAAGGLLIGPIMTMQFTETARAAPRAVITESFAWLNSLGQAGSAAAAAGAGILVASTAPALGFTLAAGMTGLAAVLAYLLRPDRGLRKEG
ncbi:MFS transporter [Streptomyces sp. cmx-18-6]|uniref:MFS transporter n=1 Tax=Streptomyces sp. cmx-18-6 TaxID=2790930 RepID=UPI00397EF8CF